ncbi:PTR2-domain-containing protein [Neoconidiobolus thromboides FSU 785]|nr:PTR2-domain-containing protein [Neoconidiobolus thromboides FSU 785]
MSSPKTKHQQSFYEDTTEIKKVPGPVPKSAWFIIVMELCERFSFYGASLLFVPYVLDVLQLGKSNATAVNRAFSFLCYFTTIIGASIADSYLGKFKTILCFAVWYLAGLIVLSLSAIPASLDSGFALPGFCIALYLFISWGTGGIKANVSAFAAEQVPHGLIPSGNNDNTYYDYDLTVERVFRYFYWAINIGSFTGQLVCPILARQGNSYPLAYGIPGIIFVVGIAIFILGRSKFNEKEINGNPLFKAIRCIRYALAHKGSNPNAEHWLDNAKVESSFGNETDLDIAIVSRENNIEWDDKFVDGLKGTLNACKVFSFYVVYWALYYNMFDNFINMGVSMAHPEWLGAEQLNLVAPIVIVACIPLFDGFVFPLLRRCGFKLGPITRITIGFILCTLGFVYATVLQHIVYQTGPYYDFTNVPSGVEHPMNDISIWWQIPAYALVAISEIFASATGLEYAFKYAAPELKSVVMALYLFTNCGGALIGLILAIWSVDPNFVILFGIQTSLLGVLTIIFWFLFHKQDQ